MHLLRSLNVPNSTSRNRYSFASTRLMTGAKADIAIKLYGEDTHELYERAKEAATFVEKVPGAADVIVEQTMGLPPIGSEIQP